MARFSLFRKLKMSAKYVNWQAMINLEWQQEVSDLTVMIKQVNSKTSGLQHNDLLMINVTAHCCNATVWTHADELFILPVIIKVLSGVILRLSPSPFHYS
jgi:hypothetical protein